MALITCPDCGRQVSDAAQNCPHCGRPLRAAPPPPPAAEKAKSGVGCGTSGCVTLIVVFVIIWVIGYFSSSGSSSSSSGARSNAPSSSAPGLQRYAARQLNLRAGPGEQHRVVRSVGRGEGLRVGFTSSGAWLPVLGATARDTAGWVISSGLRNDPLPAFEIESWNWQADPDFGTQGSVIYTGVIRNNTSEYVSLLKVEFTSFDAQGRIADTDFTYARGLAPGGTASIKGYATYFGTEKRASLRIVP